MIRINYLIIVFLIFFINISANSLVAQEYIEFNQSQSKIKGSIKYSVIGHYRSVFNDFTGKIGLDKDSKEINSVHLSIKAESIESSCLWCDKIVRSKQLLNVEKYPEIVFQSQQIIKEEKGYRTKGTLELHGVKKDLEFVFNAETIKDSASNDDLLKVNGKWIIRRKDFGVTWNKILDQGGVLVGDHISVDWLITANMPKQK